jgi:site-specific DNA-cytosine methylase
LTDTLHKDEYEVHWNLLNTTTSTAIPQNRRRMYVVGLKKTAMVHPFHWPTLYPKCRPLSDFLENTLGAPSLKLSMNHTKRTNLAALEKTPLTGDVIAELGSSYPKTMSNICPCLTATRAGDQAYWSMARGRPLTIEEMMKLQGMCPENLSGWEEVISPRQMGAIIGNAMTVQIVSRLFRQMCLAFGWAVRLEEL